MAPQVAAKVGTEEISVSQVNQLLRRTSTAGTSPQTAQAMGREVLEKLIDQQLAVEQAKETKLDRSPDVVSQIEAARREILARAYLQQIAAGLPLSLIHILRRPVPLFHSPIISRLLKFPTLWVAGQCAGALHHRTP